MSLLWILFVRLILRPLAREPVRTALMVFAVGLGVAVVLAIDLAGQAAAGSFHSSIESLSGRSDLAINAIGGVDERLLGKLIELPYAFQFTPRIEDFASLNERGEALPFIGLDLIALGGEKKFETGGSGTTDLFSIPNPIWVGRTLGLQRGERVSLLINDVRHLFTVAGILKPRAGEIGGDNAIVADIGLAQKVTGKSGKLDSIDVHLPLGESMEHWRKLLQETVPASVNVAPEGARTDENRKMLAAFRSNLRVLSYIALLVGAFLIYNAISIAVVRRRAEIGIVRALGATRGLVANGFVAEAVFIGAAGSVLGIVMGRILASGAIGLIGSTVRSLYVSSQPAPVRLGIVSMLAALALGVSISVLAAWAPAREASRVSPTEAMAHGREQYAARIRSRRTIFLVPVLGVAAAALCELPPVYGEPVFAYTAVLLLIAATALAIPNAVSFFVSTAHRAAGRLLGVEALLAMRSLGASLGRTSVLTAALATAIAMTASVGIMVGSFRETVSVWMNDQLKADFYLRPAGSSAADRHPTLNARIADQIQQIHGVRAVDRFRAYPISYEGLPATLAGGETSRIQESASTRFLPGENREEILAKLPTGDFAVVSEPFANKHRIRVGSVVALPLAGATRKFRVLGIYYDYSTERGFIVLDRRMLLKYLPDPAASNLAVYLKPGADPGDVRRRIDQAIAGHAVMVFPNRTLRLGALEVFDRTFRITYALEAVAVVVAVMGIAGALWAMVIDRRREFALLRFLGGARGQIRRIILCEAGLLGLLSNAIGLILGTLLSLILIFVINKQSFGWTIQFHWPIALLLVALTGVYVATVLAGLYPARIATRLQPIEVIHEE